MWGATHTLMLPLGANGDYGVEKGDASLLYPLPFHCPSHLPWVAPPLDTLCHGPSQVGYPRVSHTFLTLSRITGQLREIVGQS